MSCVCSLVTDPYGCKTCFPEGGSQKELDIFDKIVREEYERILEEKQKEQKKKNVKVVKYLPQKIEKPKHVYGAQRTWVTNGETLPRCANCNKGVGTWGSVTDCSRCRAYLCGNCTDTKCK